MSINYKQCNNLTTCDYTKYSDLWYTHDPKVTHILSQTIRKLFFFSRLRIGQYLVHIQYRQHTSVSNPDFFFFLRRKVLVYYFNLFNFC